MSPNQPDPLHLKPGSMVEVASDDEGFQGSRFVGKVIECLRDESSIQYVIEYETIFEDEAGKNPLRETLDISLLRPPQPEEKKKERVFEVGQVVDVYENDGWWEGSVIEVLEERKYSVYFEQTSEQHVYGGESLRVHREWVNGDRKPPVEDCVGSVIIKEKVNSNEENSAETKEQEKVNMGKENDGKAEEQEKLVLPCARKRAAVSPKQPDTSHLKPGSAVEISSDDTGFRGSWFIGTIIRCLCKKKPAKFLVEYKTLFEDEEGKKPLRETLHQYQLRPVQPTEKRPRKFKFADEVDAYFNDGWWEGDITGELGGERFNVYFRPAKEQLEFGEESLRIHREWTDGAWDPPIEDEDEGTEGKEEYKKGAKFGEDTCEETFGKGALVEVSSDEDGFRGAWFAATVIEFLEKERYIIEYTNLRTEDDTAFCREEVDSQHIRPNPPDNMVKACFKVHQEVDAFHNDGWWIGVISKVPKGGSRYKVYFRDTKEELEFEYADIRLHQDWIDGKWLVPFEDLKL